MCGLHCEYDDISRATTGIGYNVSLLLKLFLATRYVLLIGVDGILTVYLGISINRFVLQHYLASTR